MNILITLLSTACATLGILYVIRIAQFKKDAWIVYLLATTLGICGFIFFNNVITLHLILINIATNLHDFVLAFAGIFIFYTKGVKVKTINNQKQLMEIIPFIVIVAIVFIIWQSILLKFVMNVSYFPYLNIFSTIAFVGTALLIRGYVLGFLLSAIFELYMIIQFSVAGNIVSFYITALHIINLIVFTIACMKTRKAN